MYVVKRDGRQEAVHFDQITARLKKLTYGLNSEHCDHILVSQKVCAGVYKSVTTSQLDELAVEAAAAMTANHPEYASVANKLYATEQFATKMFLAAVDEHASDTGISKSAAVPENRMDIE